jgi:hypothetical protein
MPQEPLPQLSPELVLILPPEVAAIARMTLPEPGCASPAASRPARRRPTLRRAVGLGAVYATAGVLTGAPLALAMKAVPSHQGRQLHVNRQLRHDANDSR